MIHFPSVEFFTALRDEVNANPDRFRRLGTVDMTMVAEIDFDASHRERYEIVFSGYRCVGVCRLAPGDPIPGDAVVLSGPYAAWREMLANIVANGQADLEHTLNTLTLFDEPLRVEAGNQLDVDLFYRYQQNLQEFFDGAAKLPLSLRDDETPAQQNGYQEAR
ncbi:MAG TPA: hypothetical protein VMT64_16445 [Candidatus Binataceae bacterium]|nr:hypothetical protein [Candidatus Binataceae bacterium]